MRHLPLPIVPTLAVAYVLLALGGLRLGAEEPVPAKPSLYAPAADLEKQVAYYVGRLDEALAKVDDYDEAKQSRVQKDGHTLAAIGLVLALHDGESKYQSGALLKAARSLAADHANFDAATKDLAALKQVAGGGGDKQGDVSWGKVASLEALMKQVPIVNNSLKRGLDPARFKRQAEQSAGQAATLAAIAQAVLHDDTALKNPAQQAEWQALCEEMRSAAGEINTAIHSGDAAQAQAGLKKLAHNCDACHDKFRDAE